MRRILLTSVFALALLVSVGASEASAQTSYDAFGNAYSTPAEASAADTKALSAAATASTAQGAGGNQPTTPKGNSDDAYNIVMQKIMELFAWLVGVAALTLDTAVFYTVVRMGEYVNNLSAIGVAWRILRDVGNIMLIFGFLAIGITTIIDKGDWYGGGKKMLPMLFIGAIFLNFSLFITEAVIDTGNLFATQFYKQINGGNMPTAAMTASATVKNEGISNKLMSQLGMQTIYNVNDGKVRSDVFRGSNTWIIGFMGILLFIVTAFVLFSLAFVLIARFVILIFLIILAPVGFAGLAIPQLKGRAEQWWDTLFKQTLTAPVLLLMLYVALAVITDAQFLIGFNSTGATWLSYLNNNDLAGFGGVILSFLVAMGLLLFVVIASSKLSAFGAGWASQTAGKLTFGATAWAGTKTFGLGSHYAARAIGTSRLAGTRTGRVLTTAFEKGAKSSFDIRGVAVAGGLKGISVDAGKTSEGGYRGQRERTIKAHEEYIKSIDKAYEERGETRSKEEKAGIDKATEEHKLAERIHGETKIEKEGQEQQAKEHKAEVMRLEEEKKKDRYWETNPENVQKLNVAKQNLAKSEANLATVTTRFTAAANTLAAAEKAKTAAEKAPVDRMTTEKKNAKEAYAGRISTGVTENPLMWAVNLGMHGPGGTQAARKIVKELSKKSTKDQLSELVKKMAKEEEEAEKKEKPKEEKPKAETAH